MRIDFLLTATPPSRVQVYPALPYSGIPGIDSSSTHDGFHALRIPSLHTTLELSVINSSDEDPPVMWDELTHDAFTHNPLDRMVELAVRYQFQSFCGVFPGRRASLLPFFPA